MRLLQFLNESVGIERFNKYFTLSGNHKVKYNSNATKAILYDISFNKVLSINPEEDIFVYGDEHVKKGKEILVKIRYKNNDYYINVNKIHTPLEKNKTESLGIQVSSILKSGSINVIDYGGNKVSGWLFKNATDLSHTCIRGFNSIRTVPDYLKIFLSNYLNKGRFDIIDWSNDITHVEKNQLGVYFGEILAGLCLLSGTKSVFSGLPKDISNSNITGVFFPNDPSFKGVDSVIELNGSMYVGISNKKSGGASASLFGNCMEKLIEANNDINSNTLGLLVNLSKGKDLRRDVVKILYEWAFHSQSNYLSSYIQRTPYINNPYQIKIDIQRGNINDIISILSDNIKNVRGAYKPTGKVLDNMPQSLSYIITHEIANRINSDKNALNIIGKVLAAKDYYQFDLNGNKFNNGVVQYKVKHTGSSEIKILGSRAVSNDINISQSKITYQIS